MTAPMQQAHESVVQRTSSPTRRAGFHVTGWVLGIVGAIAAFVGGFILLGGDNQWVGVGGEASWRVSEIDPAWGYGLLAVGGLALMAMVGLVVHDRRRRGAPGTEPTSGTGDVLIHAAVFVAVNAFLWIQDIALGGGLDYAYWVTIPWGIGLVVHAITASREAGG
jgi:hypothetical protein